MFPAEPSLDCQSILVTGATSLIGSFLLPRLVEAGFEVHALSRKPPAHDVQGIVWHRADIEKGEVPELAVDCIIHLAILTMMPPLLQRMASNAGNSDYPSLPVREKGRSLQRIMAFSSTSRFSKQDSSNADERDLAYRLAQAEQDTADFCETLGIAWTIFRPTLIYGGRPDRNVTVIANFIQRFGFFPLIGQATGLRQPVHAEDLASACLSALDNPATFNRAYNLSGGETLAYRDMVQRIFEGLGKPPRFLRIPLPLFRAAFAIAAILPRYRYLSGEMAQRMNQDLCFDHADAARDFGYRPKAFDPTKIGV